MSLLLTALVVPQTRADELTVGNGTSTQDLGPLFDYQTGFAHGTGYVEILYPKTLLTKPDNDMTNSVISGIAFYSNQFTFTGGTINVQICETDNANLLSEITETPTTIATFSNVQNYYSSSTEKWTLDFGSNSFTYSGEKNLLVRINVTAKGSKDGRSKFYCNTTNNELGSSTIVIKTTYTVPSSYGSTDRLPKTTFTYEPAVVEDYAAKVTPSSIAFGSFSVGSASTTQNVTLKNTGANAFTPSVSVSGTNFSTTYTAAELAAGATTTIPVTFNPATAGEFTGTMTINCGEAGTFTVDLTGTAALEETVADGTDKDAHFPVWGYNYDGAQTNQMIYPASMLTDLVGKKLKSMTFYFTCDSYGKTIFYGGSVKFSLANTSVASFTSTSRITDGLVQVASVVPENGTTEKWVITFDDNADFVYTGENLLIDVVTTAGTWADTEFYGENGHTNASYTNRASSLYSFLPKVTFAYEDSENPATPVITVDPATVEAFTTEVGTPVSATVNVAGENLTGEITAAVSGANADCFTAVLENGVLTITYNPTAAGNHTATVTLSSTGAQDVAIALTGTATAPAVDYAVNISDNTGAHNYGNVLVNSSNVWTLTITNNGTQTVTPTLSGIEAPFSTTYTATALAAGESATISINYAPTELGEHSNTITISFPEAGDAIAAYTCELSGKAVDESYDPSDENEVVKLVTVDKRSIYEPAFIDNANGNTTPQQLNCYDMRFKMAQPDDPAKKIKAGDLRPGNNLFEFYAIDDFGTEFRFATINLFAEGQPSSNPSVNAMDAPIKVTPSVEYYTEEGMPVHSSYSHNTTLKYTEKTYNDINELVDLEGVIDYVNDTWSANTATNSHPDHYNFQIRGVGQYGDLVTSLTAEYVETHMTGYGNQLVMPEGWERGSFAGPNNEASDDVHTFYYYDLYIKKSFFDERGITGPVTVVVNTTLSGSGFNADNYKAMSVNGVEQIIAKEEFKDYSWTVPLMDEIPSSSIVEQVPMGVVIRLVSTGADFNRTTGIYIYGGGTGVSNVETVGIYKSSMNVKAYTQKQVDEDTDRNLIAMNAGAKTDVNVLAYGDPAVTGYVLNKNTSASTTGMTQVATANHESDGGYSVNSTGTYNARYDFVRDESLGNINGMWLPMYPAAENEYYLPVTWANGIGDDGVVRSENNTYGSAMQQVEKNGSVDFGSKICHKSSYTWQENGVTYAIYDPEVELTSELPAATGYELYNYRLWVDYDDNAPAWDFSLDDGHITLTDKMDRPLYSGQTTSIGGQGTDGKDEWEFVAPNDLEEVKLIARFYYKKTSTSNSPRIKARPTDSDRLYYVVEKQVTIPLDDIVTGIDNVTSKAVAGVKYYNVAGVESDRPFQGVNIEVTRYTDGSKSTRKILK